MSALTTEPTGPGTETWREWSDYGALLARVLLRTANDGAQPFAFALRREGAQITLVAERRSDWEGMPWAESVDAPGQPVLFEAMSPDRFEARWMVSPEQEVRLLAGVSGSLRNPLRLVSGALHGPGRENQVATQFADRLQSMLESSGAQVRTEWPESLAGLPLSSPDDPQHSRRLAPWFALLALLLYLLDLLYRRLPSTQS